MAASSIRFGSGATAEVGMDVKNLKSQKVAVFTDAKVARLVGFFFSLSLFFIFKVAVGVIIQ